jgi:hypothetical protein
MILPGMVYPTYPRIDKKVCDGYHVEAKRKLQLDSASEQEGETSAPPHETRLFHEAMICGAIMALPQHLDLWVRKDLVHGENRSAGYIDFGQYLNLQLDTLLRPQRLRVEVVGARSDSFRA